MQPITLKRSVALWIPGLIVCVAMSAQTSTDTQAPPQESHTIDPNATQFPHDAKTPPSDVISPATDAPLLWQGYETHFAVEFGGRALSSTGNSDVYATFVNLEPGVRLMDQSLEMHSTNHNGLLFDDLSESSFGIGGDPNEVVQLRASKHRWYDFSGNWRRDINFWDYNLLGNPLNPPTNTPFVPINISPDLLDLSRKMLDVNLTLLPDSAVHFLLGYSHYNNGGSSSTTVHEGTEAELSQPWHDVSDSYRFGVSWTPVARTRLSFDEFYTHDKSDTNDFLNNSPYSLSNGTGVNLGISWGNGSPCATPFLGGVVNPTCNLYTAYSDVAPYSTDIPTEQLGFQSSYFQRLHVTGRASYTGAQTHLPSSDETFRGLTTRGPYEQSVQTGSGSVQEITTSADAGVSYDITERLSLDDRFRWYDYRIPSGALFLQSYLFGATVLSPANAFSSVTCPPPYTDASCPQHTSGSSADQTDTGYSMFQAQNQQRNTIELHDDFASNVSAYIGYRFEHQRFVVDGTTDALSTYFPTLPHRGGCTASLVNGACQSSAIDISDASVDINTHSGLIGIAARPVRNLRLNADMEIAYADNVFTNIMPRHMQLYRAKVIYTPKTWLDLNASARIQEMRDLAAGLENLQHNRSFSFSAVIPFSPRWAVDMHYTYDDFLSNLNICFAETPAPAFATTSPLCGIGSLMTPSYYHDIDNFVSGNLMVKPFARTTLTAGYTVTSTTGSNLLLNPFAPIGPASINYHLPSAALALDVAQHLTFKAGWNLYDYDEKSPPGPVTPRNFRANLISVSLRYAM